MNNGELPPGFQPAPPPPLLGQDGLPVHDPAAGTRKKRGGRRGPRQAKAATKPANGRRKKRSRRIDKEIKTARVRQAAAAVAMPQTGMKVDLATALSVLSPLSPPEQQILARCWFGLASLDKKSRERVLNALVKVIA